MKQTPYTPDSSSSISSSTSHLFSISSTDLSPIYHDFFNLLQTISSLITLHAHHSPERTIKELAPVLQNRIFVLSQLYSILARQSHSRSVSADSLINGICDYICSIHPNSSSSIHWRYELDDYSLNHSQAAALAIIAYEWVSNAVIHGHPNSSPLNITVIFKKKAQHVRFSVKDSAATLSPSISIQNAPTLGLQLTDLMCQQLDGRASISRSSDTTFQLDFDLS